MVRLDRHAAGNQAQIYSFITFRNGSLTSICTNYLSSMAGWSRPKYSRINIHKDSGRPRLSDTFNTVLFRVANRSQSQSALVSFHSSTMPQHSRQLVLSMDIRFIWTSRIVSRLVQVFRLITNDLKLSSKRRRRIEQTQRSINTLMMSSSTSIEVCWMIFLNEINSFKTSSLKS